MQMFKLYTDGGSRGNPGHAAYGFVVKEDDKTIKSEGGYLGQNTNNFAEYSALIKGLNFLKENHPNIEVSVFLDSELVVKQLTGIYKIKNENIKHLVVSVRTLEESFKSIKYNHIPREKNHEADKQVNIALDKKLYGN